jgi:transposase-like protein
MLGNWVEAARDARARTADPDGLSESERVELQRLRREVIEQRVDRKILRKAAAHFARDTMR